MKTPSTVLLLLLWADLVAAEHKDLQEKATDTASTQVICQSEIHTALREMSALVAEQRVELRYTKTQMEALETRLRTTEKTVDQQRLELKQTEARLTDKLTASEILVEQLKSKNDALSIDLNLTKNRVEELRREREESRVSFSASLVESGSVTKGPFAEAFPLVYRHVFTNIGNAYNPDTGVFTAPVRGVYHFVIFVDGIGHATTWTGVSLRKNGKHVVIAHAKQPTNRASSSNAASLLLELGDVVYVKLWPTAWVFDSYNHHTTFSGHLLFPM